MSTLRHLGRHRAAVLESRENPPNSDIAEKRRLGRVELDFLDLPGEEQIGRACTHAAGASSSLGEGVEEFALMAGRVRAVVAQVQACGKRELSEQSLERGLVVWQPELYAQR